MWSPTIKLKREKQKHNVGADSGELFIPHVPVDEKVKITLIQYSSEEFYEEEFYSVKECKNACRPGLMRWIDIDGIHVHEVIEKFGKWFNIHPLTLEDITHVDSRPKFEEYSRYVIAMLKMLYFDTQVQSEHLSILLFEDTVLTFQEPLGGDAFDLVRDRLRQNKGVCLD